jgi:Flp pilus assembly protein TadB
VASRATERKTRMVRRPRRLVMTSRDEKTDRDPASLRRAILWSATAFLAVAIAGFWFAPGLRLLWVVIVVFGVAAVPQAFRRDR